MDLDTLEAHPFANFLPMIQGEQFSALVEDIRRNGLIEPIILYNGMILDGRNRYCALKHGGYQLKPENTRPFEGTEQEALDLVLALNLRRRHLSSSQRALAAVEIANLRKGRPSGTHGVTSEAAAQALNVSPFLVKIARRIKRICAPHIVAMVERGDLKIAAAEIIGRLSSSEQAALTSPSAVRAEVEKQRKAMGGFRSYSAGRLLETIVEISEEPFARESLGEFADAATTRTLPRLDIAIERLQQLRDELAMMLGRAEAASS